MLLAPLHRCAVGRGQVGFTRITTRGSPKQKPGYYVKVCKLLYQTEEDPDLLLSYADSIHQLAIDSGKPEIFIEYYIWLSEGYFIKGDFEQGYALKRKAIDLAEKAGLRFTIAQACCDMGYYCNADACYDSARLLFS